MTLQDRAYGRIGDPTTRLVVLRGNSGSGKSTTARELRRTVGRGVAWIEQDYLRRTLLREHPAVDAPNIGLIDQTARYALRHGYHVILEGIFENRTYGVMVRQLIADHAGRTGVYYFDIPLEETLRRHATKPLAGEVGAEKLRDWYLGRDVLGVPGERVIEASSGLEETVARIVRELAWTSGGAIAHAIDD